MQNLRLCAAGRFSPAVREALPWPVRHSQAAGSPGTRTTATPVMQSILGYASDLMPDGPFFHHSYTTIYVLYPHNRDPN